jgi:filamentous hemagglutinin family protein
MGNDLHNKKHEGASRIRLCATGCLLLALLPALPPALALAEPSPTQLPVGANVTSGQATISSLDAVMNVNQSSQKAIINWNRFDVGSQARVNFNQPHSSSQTLNRVVSGSASQIYGNISANGQIYLINPNGVVFGAGSQVSAAGVVASTLDVTDENFTKGILSFQKKQAAGSIINKGTIVVQPGGHVALIGANVENSGVIHAPSGRVVLAAGDKVEVPLTDSGLISIEATVQDAPHTVATSGRIDVSSANGNGGSVALMGKAVKIESGAKILANGKTGGGTIIIGNKLKTETTTLGSGTLIDASAMEHGNGGNVIVWSKLSTVVGGTILAQGGRSGGDGGFVETSSTGSVRIADTARINTLAFLGKTGQWLLDPEYYTIAASGGDETGASVEASLATSNRTISADNIVYVNDAIAWSANTLTLSAGVDIEINAIMTATGSAGLVMTATSGSVRVGLSGSGFIGKVNLASGTSLTINGHAYTIINSLGAAGSTTGTDLQGMSGNLAGYYALGSDIDASATATWNWYEAGGYYYGFTPVGDSTTKFSGVFSGLGHTVSNLYIFRPPASFIGLFGYLNNANISNIGVINAQLTGYNYVGALMGRAYSTPVWNSYATGDVTGTHSYIGGLIGEGGSTIDNTFAVADVYGTSCVGALMGRSGAIITRSWSSGSVGSNSAGAGGLVGQNTGTISESYSTALVSSTSSWVGGLVGNNTATGSISTSYALGKVYGANSTGGLVGYNEGVIDASYSSGRVTSPGTLGGLVGIDSGTISNSYWNITTSGQPSSAGGTGLTTAEILQQGSFSGWDFASEWTIFEGSSSPYLQWQGTPGIINGTGNLVGATVGIVINGNLVSFGSTGSDGTIYFLLPEGALSTGDNLLLYNVGGGASAANAVYLAGSSLISGLSLTANTLWGGSGNGVLKTSDLVTAKGSLTSSDIRYSVSGSEITLLSTTTLTNTSVGGVTIDTGINWNANTLTISPSSGNIAINAVMNATGTAGLVMTAIGGITTALSDSGFIGKVNLASGTSLTINGHAYTIINSLGAADSTTGTDLQGMSGNLAGYYALGSDIDASATATWNWYEAGGYYYGFTPVGSDTSSFTGQFNGLGHTISGLNINHPAEDFVGMFGENDNGSILTSVGLINPVIRGVNHVGSLVGFNDELVTNSYVSGGNVIGTGAYVGGLVGANYLGSWITYSFASAHVEGPNYAGVLAGISRGSISYSHSSGSVSGLSNIGGLAGFNESPISYCSSSANVSGTGNYIGGLIGVSSSGDISYSFASGNVSGLYAGGLVGQNSVTISQSYATGTVEGGYSGGLVGRNQAAGIVEDSYATGNVESTDTGDYNGGLVGYNWGTIRRSYATGDVDGRTHTGGLTGMNRLLIEYSFATGDVTSNSTYVGGLSGANYTGATIRYSYATGSVVGGESGRYFGGLVGYNRGSIDTAYATGYVYAPLNAGGLVGYTTVAEGSVANGFWNITATGQASSSGDATGLTTAQARVSANYSGWDFASIWAIEEGVTQPYLQWQGLPNIIQATGNLAAATPVQVAVDGVLVGTGAAAADGSVYITLPQGSFGAGDILLLYNVGEGASAANAVYVAGDRLASGLSLTSGTLWADSANAGLSTSNLVTAKGSLTSSDIRYSVSGSEITLLSTTTLTNSSVGGVTIDTGINWSANTLTISPSSGNIAINAVMNATAAAGLEMTALGGITTALSESGFSGKVNLASGTSLTINGNAYTIINSLGAAGSTTGTDLQGMNGNRAGYYALGSDIDASATATWNWNAGLGYYNGFSPIGITAAPFTGVFNGLGHTVSGLYTRRTGYYTGFFGNTSGAIFHNIGLTGHTVISTAEYVGGLAAYTNAGSVYNSFASGSVTGRFGVGGLLGYAVGGTTVINAFTTGTVGGNNHSIGGLVGYASAIDISYSHSSVTINSTDGNVGGLVGYNNGGGSITNSYASGNVSGTTSVGGLVGYNTGSITDSYATGNASGGGYIGGLAGRSNGTITQSYARGDATGTGGTIGGLVGYLEASGQVEYSFAIGTAWSTANSNVGGLIGYNLGGLVRYSFATGSASGTGSVGGLAGFSSGTIENSYAIGNAASAGLNAGGLVGRNDGTISYSYASGVPTGTQYIGGLVGANNGTISSSYWNTTTSGRATSSGAATGLTTAQMMAEASFSGWDFASTWAIMEGSSYPYLQWQGVPSLIKGTGNLTGQTVRVAINGALVQTGSIGANGSFYIILPEGSVSSGTKLLLYGASNPATAVYVAGSNVAAGLSLTSGTLWADAASGALSNATLASAVGSLSSANLLYSASGNDISMTAGTSTLRNSSGGGIVINGEITTSGILNVEAAATISAGVTAADAAVNFNNAVTLASDVVVNSGTAATSFASTVNGAYGLTVTAGTINLTGAVGGSTALASLTANGAVALNSNITTNGAVFLNSSLTLGGNSTINAGAGAITFGGSIVNSGYSLSATGTEIEINGTASWSANTLSFAATTGDLDINAVMNATGTAGLVMAAAGDVNVALSGNGFTGRVDMASGTSLTIDGYAYTIINSLGTASSSTGTDLQGMRGNRAGYYALGSNIDASATAEWNSGAGFTLISNSSGSPFTGAFTGLGHTITGLVVYRPSTSAQSMFGYVGSTASIRSVGLVNASVTGSYYAAGIAGLNTGGAIGNSYVTGSVTGSSSVGGLAGYNSGTISGSSFSGSVTGSLRTGGVVGENEGTVSFSHASGTVTGGSSTGGVVGSNPASGTINDSYATSNVSGTSAVGGVVGYNSQGTVNRSYATGSVSGTEYVGGFAGQNNGNISTSYATGSAIGSSSVGGFVGRTYSGTISNSAAYGSATGDTYVGSFMGVNNGGTVQRSFGGGYVSGTGLYVAGFAGRITSGSSSGNYFNTTTTGKTSSSGATGITSPQMKAQATFGTWDFGATWAIMEGVSYPYLQWQGTPSIIKGTGNLAGGQAVRVAVNGAVVRTGATGADGSFYLLLPEATVESGDYLLLYTVGGGASGANAVYRASGNATSGLGLSSGTLWVDNGVAESEVSIANFTGALGSLSSTDILYGVSGNNLTISASTALFANTGGDGITLNGDVTSSGTVTFSDAVTLASHVAVSAGAVSFGAVDGGYDLTLTAGTIALGGVIGGSTPLSSLSANGGVALNGSITTTGAIGFSNALTLGGSSSVTAGGTLTFDGSIGNNGHNLNATGASIALNAPTSWSANTLTFTSTVGDIDVNAVLSATGTAGLAIAAAGDVDLMLTSSGFTSRIDMASGTSLTIDGHAYTIINSLGAAGSTTGTDLQGMHGNLAGYYALGSDIDASATAGWNSGAGFAPVGSNLAVFTGAFNGLGHVVSGLAINRTSTTYVALFGFIGSTVEINSIGIRNYAIGGLNSAAPLVGWAEGSVKNSFATGNLSGQHNVGGLIGYINTGGSVDGSYAVGTVAATGSFVGGLVGHSYHGSVSDSYASVDVSGTSYTGGLVGHNDVGIITNSFATGSVNASNTFSGGLVGYNVGGTITSTYATGSILSTSNYVGGLVGGNSIDGTISYSYSTGYVQGASLVGGLVGYNWGTVTTSYFNTATSGRTGASGLTTLQMMAQGTFTGWDFGSTWTIMEGASFPYLQWQGTPSIIKGTGNLAGGQAIRVAVNGAAVGSGATGADGSFYILLPEGAVLSGDYLLLYTVGNGANAVYRTASSVTSGISLSSETLWADIGVGSFSNATLVNALGSLSSTDILYSASGNNLTFSAGTTTLRNSLGGGIAVDGTISTTGILNIEDAATISANITASNAAIAFGDTVTLAGDVTVDSGTAATSFGSAVDGAYDLSVAAGTINFADAVGGNVALDAVSLLSSSSLTLPSIHATSILARATGTASDLVIDSGSVLTATGSGTAVALAAGRNFINQSGAFAIDADNGRWLIYSASPSSNAYGGLDSGNTAVWHASYGDTLGHAGNRYVFAYQPTLTFASTSASKEYGDVADLSAAYSVSGLESGVTGAYLGDTESTAFSGTPLVASAGADSSASVAGAPYAMTLAQGTLASVSGYAFDYSSTGVLAVTPASLSVVANAISKVSGELDPELAYAATGFKANDTASVLTGSLLREAGEAVGTYAITEGSLGTANYTIAFEGNSFTIISAPVQDASPAAVMPLIQDVQALAFPNPIEQGEIVILNPAWEQKHKPCSSGLNDKCPAEKSL